MKNWTRFKKLFVTYFGLGMLPVAPGTWGAAGGLLTAIFIHHFVPQAQLVLVVLTICFTIIGALFAKSLEPEWGEDPSRIVIDEVVGMWISMLFLPFRWECYVLSFILFRLFDIYKPFYIRKMESIGNGWGVMLDDVLAGVYANFAMQIVVLVFTNLLIFQ